MPASEAQVAANRRNSALSTGPKTDAGKEKSRQNSLKHGMTGAGVVLAEADAAEVERRTIAFAEDLVAIDEVGLALARRAALNSVRMERGADQQNAALARRCRQVEADFVAPEGLDEAEAAKLRAEAVRIAMFDPSPEATLARKYEAAAERGFFRAIKELRQMERQAEASLKAQEKGNVDAMMASIFAAQQAARAMDDEMDALYPELAVTMPRPSAKSSYLPPAGREVDVPMTIGRSR